MRHKIYHRKSCKYMSQETRDISLDGEVHVSEDPDVMDTDECPEEGDEALQVEEEPCEPTEPTEAEPSLELPSRAELRAAVAMDSHEPPRERATTTARGLRNTWVDVTPGMSWHERESAERKAHGKSWKMDTSLKRPSLAELRAAVAMDSHEPPRERATTMARGLRNTWVDVIPGMSWHERERAERKAHGKNRKMHTSLKAS